MAKKDKNEYVVITDKTKLAIGNKIFVKVGGPYTEHIIRKRLVFDHWEETRDEYRENYIEGWLKPMFKNGCLYELIEKDGTA